MGYTEEKDFEIHHYEIDLKKRVLISRMMNFFDDVAVHQSEKLGIGLDYLSQKGLTWVLYQWNIEIKKYPFYRDIVKVWTEPTGFNKYYAYRRYSISGSDGGKMAEAHSVWFLVDVGNKRPVKVTEDIYKAYGVDEEKKEVIANEKIEAPISVDAEREFSVRYNDIDTNGHVNNARYVDWAIEALPEEILRDYSLEGLKIAYKKETKYGEKVSSLVEITKGDGFLKTNHKVCDSSGIELCLLENTWRKD